MTYEISKYSGNDEYIIDCTGDAVIGDEVRFERATFSGSFRNPKFAGFKMIEGVIVKDSYGLQKQQHTFTIKTAEGDELRIKGRNLYANGLYRKSWADESLRHAAVEEKHSRGDLALVARELRREC